VKFVLDVFPLVVTVGAMTYTDDELRDMSAGFDELFTRGDRFALISYTPDGAEMPNARARKGIADWADSPRVRAMSKKLCVASATVVQNALARGALTAIMWIWKPPSPHKAVSNPNDAVEWCLEHLAAARIPLNGSRDELFAKLAAKAFGSSLVR
jgi:hypothetical protein